MATSSSTARALNCSCCCSFVGDRTCRDDSTNCCFAGVGTAPTDSTIVCYLISEYDRLVGRPVCCSCDC